MVSPDLQKREKLLEVSDFCQKVELGRASLGEGEEKLRVDTQVLCPFFPGGSLPSFCGSDEKEKERELKAWKIRASKKKRD